MAKSIASKKEITFNYDFTRDGGAIGTIGMGVFIPANAVLNLGHAKIITTCTSGGGATISVGWTGATTILINAAAVATFTAGAVVNGALLSIAPVTTGAVLRELAVTIGVAALTAGRFLCTYEWVNYNE